MGSILLVLAFGALASRIRIGSIYLGALGALLVGIAGGQFGIQFPKPLSDFGVLVLLFVLGAQAGPRFVRTFKREGGKLLLIGGISIVIAVAASFGLQYFIQLPREIFLGSVSGGLSSAAAFAALLDSIHADNTNSIVLAYSAAFPVSTILILFFVPIFLKFSKGRRSRDEAYWASHEPPALERKSFKVTNLALSNKKISEIEPLKMLKVNLSRINRNGAQFPIAAHTVIQLGDIVTAVGEPRALGGLGLVLGEESQSEDLLQDSLMSIETYVTSSSVAGKSLRELEIRENFGVTITRIRRDGAEFLPRGGVSLEFGDLLVVIGASEAIEKFTKYVNPDRARLDETQIAALILGMAFGVFVGSIPVSVYGSTPIQLGPTGGVFVVSMILGYIRGIGRIRLYLPAPAANVLRELGLLLFIVGTGTYAGQDLSSLYSSEGVSIIAMSSAVSLILMCSSIAVAKYFRFDSFSTTGIICGIMNASSGLPRVGSKYLRDVSSLFYASLYPVTLIFKVIVVQVIALIL